jgi:hypothetical protein
MSDRRTNLLWAVLGTLPIAVAAVLLYQAWPMLYPEVAARAPLNIGCDPGTGPCAVVFEGGGEVTLDIRPQGIPVVEPLQLKVTINGIESDGVELEFAGVDMNMGFNRVSLERAAPGHFVGKGVLPVCVRNRMTWEARVLLHTSAGNLVAPFRFDTYRR